MSDKHPPQQTVSSSEAGAPEATILRGTSKATTPPLRGTPPYLEGSRKNSPPEKGEYPEGGRGLIPKLRFPEFREAAEWAVKQLDEVCEVLNNQRKPITSGSRVSGPYPYYGASGIVDYVADFIFDKRLVLVGEDGAKWGAFEKTAFIAEGKYWVNNHAHVLNPCGVNDVLLEAYLTMLDMGPYVTGAAPPKLTLGKLKQIPISIPALPEEQQKIADCLSSLDALIAAQAEKIDALETHKKGLMQQLFPQNGETIPRLRFSEFREAGEWEVSPFGSLAKFLSGGTPSKNVAEYWGGEIPWISASSMHNTKIKSSESNVTSLAVSAGARIARKGTLLLLVRGSMLYKRIPLGIAEIDVAFNQDVKAIELKSFVSESYIMHFLIASEAKLLATVTATGIGAGKLDTGDLNDFPITYPLVREQNKIVECLSFMDDLIIAETEKLDALKTHKKGLMQQLFPAVKNEAGS